MSWPRIRHGAEDGAATSIVALASPPTKRLNRDTGCRSHNITQLAIVSFAHAGQRLKPPPAASTPKHCAPRPDRRCCRRSPSAARRVPGFLHHSRSETETARGKQAPSETLRLDSISRSGSIRSRRRLTLQAVADCRNNGNNPHMSARTHLPAAEDHQLMPMLCFC